MTLSPANRARPSSKTELITWLCLAFPNSLSANRERMAQPAGIIFDPGRSARLMSSSNGT